MTRITLLICSIVFIISACSRNENFPTNLEQYERDIELIEAYVAEKNLDVEVSASGLYYVIEEKGNGKKPDPTDNVKIRFSQYLLDGTLIGQAIGDSSIVFNLATTILGLREGIGLLKEGGRGTFILPSYMAFGGASSSTIPANSVMVFDVELVEIITPEKQLAIDIEIIDNYLEDNNTEAQKTDSGIHYYFEEEGDGERPDKNSSVTVKYKGYFLDGTVFDQTTGDDTATFPLSGVIQGWQEGIPLFKKGGKGTLLIPSALAYGTIGNSSIPPNTVLAFDIELVDFE